MTDGMKWAIVLTVCIIAFGRCVFLWDKYSPPPGPPIPAAQQRADTYYGCVQTSYENGSADKIQDCNQIQ